MANANILRNDRGQTMIVFALLLSVLVLFTGFAVDAGLLYVTKAKLSSSVDSSCLTGMKNLQSGQATATTLATDMFTANYGANAPTPSVTYPTDQYNDQQVQVTATANVRTYFMQLIPGFATVPVSDTAVATRGKLIMTIVLDRSGSMCGGSDPCPGGVVGDDGGEALQVAVPEFVDQFNNSSDEVGLVSFSSGSTIDFSINTNFQTSITNDVKAYNFSGGTFGTGAGTGSILSSTNGPPLSMADTENNSVEISPGQPNVVKVVVYFTDGLMNELQDTFTCYVSGAPKTYTLNYGGYDSGNDVEFFSVTAVDYGLYNNGFTYDGTHTCKNSAGNNVTTFPSQQSGTQVTISRANVTAEAQYRAIQTAIKIRTESPYPTYIFTMGLGSSVSPTTQAFLAQLANDPSYSTYITTQPAGLFQYIPNCPSSTCTADVDKAFQTIAAKVLLRLTE